MYGYNNGHNENVSAVRTNIAYIGAARVIMVLVKGTIIPF